MAKVRQRKLKQGEGEGDGENKELMVDIAQFDFDKKTEETGASDGELLVVGIQKWFLSNLIVDCCRKVSKCDPIHKRSFRYNYLKYIILVKYLNQMTMYIFAV